MQSFIENKSKMHAMNTKPSMNNMRGFTLVELMIVVLLTAIAVIAIYRGYTAFSQSADAQEQIIEMQQNLRIGMYALARDIRRAGMKEEDSNLIAFVNADADTVEFVMDLGSANGPVNFATDGDDNDGDDETDEEDEARIGDGDITDDGEQIHYWLNLDEDTNGNGLLDAGEDVNDNGLMDKSLQREVLKSGVYNKQTIITNVSALNFVYLDVDGNPIPALPITVPGILDDIDSVEITMVVHTTNEDLRITNSDLYNNQLGTWSWASPGDHFRRRALSMRVKVRNANL